jgi:hypothetical protein
MQFITILATAVAMAPLAAKAQSLTDPQIAQIASTASTIDIKAASWR